jgi:CRISPR-associated endonuclease/helicase Cas3
LQKHALDGSVNFGINHFPSFESDEELATVISPVLNAPVLLPSHLDSLAQTYPRPAHEIDIGSLLHGPDSAGADVQIIWRMDVTTNLASLTLLIERLECCRPSSLEAISIPIAAARQWLREKESPAIADVEGRAEGEAEEWRTGKKEKAGRSALRWDGEDSKAVTASEIRPGDIIIVDTDFGGLAADSFDPDSKVPVTDLSEVAQLRGRGIATIFLDSAGVTRWDLTAAKDALPEINDDSDERDFKDLFVDWAKLLPDEKPEKFKGTQREWAGARKTWSAKSKLTLTSCGITKVLSAPVAKQDRSDAFEFSDALTEDDGSSFREKEISLLTHSQDVRTVTKQFASAIFDEDFIVEDLALAAWFHDVGKADARFQKWLVGGSEIRASLLPEPLAKSALPNTSKKERNDARKRAKYPAGYRHELLSVDMISRNESALAAAHDRDLVLHLVASHHGYCRPFAPPVDAIEDIEVQLDHDGCTLKGATRHQLAKLDSGIADRYWKLVEKYGWWGLCWLESIIRLADHRASALEAMGESI